MFYNFDVPTFHYIKILNFFASNHIELMKEDTRIISVCSQKGGSGKSAITIWLANCLSRENKRVLVLDADGQRTIAKLRAREIERLGEGRYERRALSGLSLIHISIREILCTPCASTTKTKPKASFKPFIA